MLCDRELPKEISDATKDPDGTYLDDGFTGLTNLVCDGAPGSFYSCDRVDECTVHIKKDGIYLWFLLDKLCI